MAGLDWGPSVQWKGRKQQVRCSERHAPVYQLQIGSILDSQKSTQRRADDIDLTHVEVIRHGLDRTRTIVHRRPLHHRRSIGVTVKLVSDLKTPIGWCQRET
ncbi:hypothetical protein ASPCADRAFT_212078 [Aspergillus carbonarius ITEM 5010]|uniref:Uncharacterized protein n=1 Tax=Aspergillus carbonarius (strain ITEM 5010) TaxID=602072 RepID=A0A1R3R760_ASPC5|nr:hypothetical protein ASPCADRAFT_212078 [Aspergillus carbonarius ITEM 5010]